MKNIFKIIFIAIFATVSFGALAADWTVTQRATITSPTLEQGNDTIVSNSEQAINGIALKTDEDNLASGSSQLATLTSTTSLNLTQGDLVNGSSQAINYLEAQDVGTMGGAAVTQRVTSASTATTLTQEVANSGGARVGNVQALNIGKASATGTINNLNQAVTESGTLSLIQDDVETADNVQAVNYAFGRTIGVDASNMLEQTTSVTGTGITTFSQQAAGNNNRQGGNVAVASDAGSVVAASQMFTANANITLNQTTFGENNVQAMNYAFGQLIGGAAGIKLDQDADVTGTTTFTQGGGAGTGDKNRQGGNVVVASTIGTVLAVSQNFTANGEIGLTQSVIAGSDGNVQALNQIDTTVDNLGTVGTVEQIFEITTAGDTTFTSTAASETNVQAANLVDTGDSIDDLMQRFTASSSPVVTFDMTGAGNSNIQAGNMARIVEGTIGEITQTFTGSAMANTFNQASGASNLVQSGNFIDIGTGALTDTSGAHQVFTTGMGSITMTQLGGGTSNLQSLNAITDKPNGTAATQAHQTISTTGAFMMSQNAMTASGQFGNFAGEEL